MDYSGIYEAYQQIYEQPPEDIFECVVNYLLDEGYCDSEESALLVAEEAGVDWILNIVEAADNTIRTVEQETPETPKRRRIDLNTIRLENEVRHPRKKRPTRLSDGDTAVWNESVSYLLDAGYADTYEAAEHIIGAMSEEWFNDIVEANMGERKAGLNAIQRYKEREGKDGRRHDTHRRPHDDSDDSDNSDDSDYWDYMNREYNRERSHNRIPTERDKAIQGRIQQTRRQGTRPRKNG